MATKMFKFYDRHSDNWRSGISVSHIYRYVHSNFEDKTVKILTKTTNSYRAGNFAITAVLQCTLTILQCLTKLPLFKHFIGKKHFARKKCILQALQ